MSSKVTETAEAPAEQVSADAVSAAQVPVGQAPVGQGELTHPAAGDLAIGPILAALAEPARLSIIRSVDTLVAGPEGVLCTDVWEHTGLGGTKSTMSHHYKVLRDAGVVEMWWAGPKKRIRLRRGDLDDRWPGLLDACLKG